jgi:hypothetical protein
MDPKIAGTSEVNADVRLKFKAINGKPVLAKRRATLLLTNKSLKFESIEQLLKTKDENNN